MPDNNRILLVGRQQGRMEQLTGILEMAGFIVTATTDDGVAIDLAGSSTYEALLIDSDVAQPDRRYVATQCRNRDRLLVVLTINSPRSLLTQLRQAGLRT